MSQKSSVMQLPQFVPKALTSDRRLFLGDSGAYALSIAIALLVIYVYGVKFSVLPADVVALWFVVPTVDCPRLMITRVLAGRSPFSSDRNHLHHI